jgi:tRNA pseudouridine55 synthase
MEGILLVQKPAGWTSFDVVAYIRRMIAELEQQKPRSIKIGHSGTLDPFATGLLVLLVGKNYTRKAADFTKQDKTYDVTMQLGIISTTGDPEGQLESHSSHVPTVKEIEHTFESFQGTITQMPPAYSAIKINGQRAYKLARAGQNVSLPSRTVSIQQITIHSYDYPLVKFTASVSSGTYIRSLVEDIGRNLGTGAYTTELSRTCVGNFTIDEAFEVTKLNAQSIRQKLRVT